MFQSTQFSITHVGSLSIVSQNYGLVLWEKSSGVIVKPVLLCTKERVASLIKQLSFSQNLALYKEQLQQQLSPHHHLLHLIWLFKTFPDIQRQAEKNKLYIGGIDSWILYNLTGMDHVSTDYSNACQTYLFDIHKCEYDDDLLSLFNIPRHCLPQVLDSNACFAFYNDIMVSAKHLTLTVHPAAVRMFL